MLIKHKFSLIRGWPININNRQALEVKRLYSGNILILSDLGMMKRQARFKKFSNKLAWRNILTIRNVKNNLHPTRGIALGGQ